MNIPYDVRRLVTSDISDVLQLLHEHANTQLIFADLLKYIILEGYDSFIALDASGSLVGVIAGHLCDTTSFINILCVSSSHRRQGLAKYLLQYLMQSQVASALSLDVRVSNDNAQRVYEHWGFTRSGTKPHYYRNEDSYTMMKKVAS